MRVLIIALCFAFAGCGRPPVTERITDTPPPDTTTQPPLTTLPKDCPRCHQPLFSVPVLIGFPLLEDAQRESRGEALLGGCLGDDHLAVVCLRCRKYIEQDAKLWQPMPTNFGTDKKSSTTPPK